MVIKMEKDEKLKVDKKEYRLIFSIAFLMGILGQTIIPWLSIKLNLSWFNFRFLISNIDIYPFIVVLLITYKNTNPKKAFMRTIIYFLGLCLGYYGYTSTTHVYHAIEQSNTTYLSNILFDLNDVFGYLVIGSLAGIWGYLILKYKNKKYIYYLMPLPFVLLAMYVVYSNVVHNPTNIFMIIVDVLGLIGTILLSFGKNNLKP